MVYFRWRCALERQEEEREELLGRPKWNCSNFEMGEVTPAVFCEKSVFCRLSLADDSGLADYRAHHVPQSSEQ